MRGGCVASLWELAKYKHEIKKTGSTMIRVPISRKHNVSHQPVENRINPKMSNDLTDGPDGSPHELHPGLATPPPPPEKKGPKGSYVEIDS